MEYIAEWMKKIAVFYVIATLVKKLVPSDKYGKYIKLFLGIVLIILVLKPVGKFANLESRYEKYFGDFTYNSMSDELACELDAADARQQSIIISEYTGSIENDIRNYVEGLGASCEDCEVSIDTNPQSEKYGRISMIKIQIKRGEAYNYNGINIDSIVIDSDSSGEGSFLQVRIKNYLSDVYNLDHRNIYVNILN